MMLSLDAKERVLDEVAKILQGAESQPASNFAESESDTVDAYTQQALKSSEGLFAAFVDRFQQLLEGSSKLEEVRDKVFALYADLPASDFAEVMGSAIAAAELAGRYEVLQEGEVESEVDLAETLEFAKKGVKSGTLKQCKKGYSCGYSCISKAKQCQSVLEGQAKNYANWLAGQVAKRAPLSGYHQADAIGLGLINPETPTEVPIPPKQKQQRQPKAQKESAKPLAIDLPIPTGDPQKAVLQLEDVIRKQDFESAAAFDREGNQVLFKNGSTDAVEFTWEEVQTMKDCVFTHNHPDGWNHPTDNPQWHGNSFSPEDWHLASAGEMAELRAVSPGYRHSIKPPVGGWNAEYHQQILEPAIEAANRAVTNEMHRKIDEASRQGRQAQIEMLDWANANHWHLVASRVSNQLGIPYTREEYRPWQ
jgi:hypothetical protein